MTCPTCGATATPGQRFCGDCGTALQGTCPACGQPHAPGQRFCGSCGAALDAAASSTAVGPTAGSSPTPATPTGPIAERRLVTVLFADLVGFTTYAEGRDSEEVRDTLSRYFELASDLVGRYGGTIEKFIGDAVMAVWGTPTAREDDAERAVRAALELIDAVRSLGPTIQARAGVLTGEAAVTIGATNQGMVAGDLVNTASRLQSVAPVGTVLVGDATHRAASRAIVFEPVGDVELKGKVAPVPAWRAVRVVAERGGRGRSETQEAPFVGRDDDLRLMKELFHATERERRVRLVSVQGIGGIGKSRLAWEFLKYLDGIADDAWWHEGRSPAYDQGITFWALADMVRARARLSETADEPETRAAIATMLDEHVAAGSERDWVERALLELVGVRTEIPTDELFSAWRTFFERLADTYPVVLVFQDLHWADAGTLQFIDHLLEWSRGSAIYVITLARPELLDRRPDWGAAQRSFTSIHLEPLPEAAMRELLVGLVPGLPPEAVAAVVTRAEGIPLYAVETVRMLTASGSLVPDEDGVVRPVGDLTDLAVPETLTALIAARLDALDPGDRTLLLDAAVLGQSFTPAGLAAVSGVDQDALEPRLRSLVRREVLTFVSDPRSPERGQYGFVQALIREVAYNTLSHKDRKTRHLAAARWFETLDEEELAGAQAGHYLSARQNATDPAEADALAAQARIALRGAAERAAALGSHQQVVAYVEQALEVTTDPREIAELSERAGESAVVLSDYDTAERHLLRAIELHRDAGDRSAAAAATGRLGTALLTGRRMDAAMDMIRSAVDAYADLGEDAGLLFLRGQLARGLFLTNENGAAVEQADRVLAMAEPMDLVRIVADTMVTRGSALVGLGRHREGIAVVEAAARLAERHGYTDIQLRAINNAMSQQADLDPYAALEASRSGMIIATRLGQRYWIHALSGNFAYVALRTGDWDEAVVAVEESLAGMHDPLDRIIVVNNLANIRILRGQDVEALFAEMEAAVIDNSDLTAASFFAESRAWAHMARWDLGATRDTWLEVATLDPVSASTALGWTARLDLWLGDRAAADDHLAAFYRGVGHGGAVDTTRDTIRAGMQAFDGDRIAAATMFREVRRSLQALRLPVDEAFLAFDQFYALGPDDPLTVDGIALARRTFADLGATPLVAALDRLDPAGTTAAPATATERIGEPIPG